MRNVDDTGDQGWTDTQIVMSLVLLNIAGGDCVGDLRILEGDDGFTQESLRKPRAMGPVG